jgi:hypothetical protein
MSQLPPTAAPMPGRSRYLEWHPENARRAIEAIARYDIMRVHTYQARPGNPEAIEVRSFGGATALQFPAVGYFNQIYQFREEDFLRLPEIKAFYAARARIQTARRPGHATRRGLRSPRRRRILRARDARARRQLQPG